MAVTHGSFTSNSTHWYDLLHRSSGKPDNYSICKESSFTSCEKLSILDLAVFNNHILLVTSKGVLRSESIDEASGLNIRKVRLPYQRLVLTVLEGSLSHRMISAFYINFYSTLSNFLLK